MTFLTDLWASAKLGFSLRLGPVTLHSRFRKTMPKSARKVVGANHAPRPYPAPKHSDGGKMARQTALIVGSGARLGTALARQFSSAGMGIIMARRRPELLEPLITELSAQHTPACAIQCDATDYRSVIDLFRVSRQRIGDPSLVIYNVEDYSSGNVLDISPPAFEDCWRANCLGGFFVGRQAAAAMVNRGSGTIIFTGATGSLRGRNGFANMAVGKFGLRALAQCMARELGPLGVHVAHVVIDGALDSMGPERVAENYFQIHQQANSAWTHELDLRREDEPW